MAVGSAAGGAASATISGAAATADSFSAFTAADRALALAIRALRFSAGFISSVHLFLLGICGTGVYRPGQYAILPAAVACSSQHSPNQVAVKSHQF